MKKVVAFKVELVGGDEPWLLELKYKYRSAKWFDTPRLFKDLMSLTAYVIQFPHGNGGREMREEQGRLF